MTSRTLRTTPAQIVTPSARSAWLRRALRSTLTYALLIALAVIMLLPFIWMFSASLKLDKDVFRFPIEWIPQNPQWSNYRTIWTRIPFLTFFYNSLKLTAIITFLQVATSSFAAYAFAKLEFKGKNFLFLAYIASIAVPWQVYMIPQFILIRELGLVDNHMSLILLQAFTAFGVFLLRQFFVSVPNELLDAARIDGLSEYGIYFRIMLPLSKPALATLTIFSAVFVWNDFMGPLIYLHSDSLKTIQLGLRMFIQQYSADYSLIMAASLVSVIPVAILFLAFQRYFVEGIGTTGIKG
ncbi:MAG TPA: carbohydrate ABC transporter permease [Aggregatilinea sp.]|jgi:multiple sugar transport system permease protein|uniref:carbohydrate ABC transporter permease n=1 Tax=Aggregatilinea sp. TaxID=2806333 RepID=UPI002D087F77|nr:carbohydrate ABC transporter permease [Aggregatilinea sp.]HML22896.1 carbohydrate ABC transporter permease [Aggregatilinea sp.]